MGASTCEEAWPTGPRMSTLCAAPDAGVISAGGVTIYANGPW